MVIPTHFFFLFLLLSSVASFDITNILSQFPDFSVFNGYLSQTNLAYAINSRRTITILAVDNGAMSELTGHNLPIGAIKRILSVHVVLDYYDTTKLHHLTHRSSLLTTLFQTTGTATNQAGFLNVTVLSSGTIAFGSGIHGAGLTANFVKSVVAEPYDVSVLQISSVIIPPGFENPPPPGLQIAAALQNAGFKALTAMLQSTGAIQTYQNFAGTGLTVFAPRDQALSVVTANLTADQKASLVLYHAVSGYLPSQFLSKVAVPLGTLASNGNSKFQLHVKANGQNLALSTGFNTVNVVRTVLDQQQVVIYLIDAVLQPPEIFSPSSLKTPPAPEEPTPVAPSPDESMSSPPAPTPSDDSTPVAAPVASPPSPPDADAPVADGPDSSSPKVPKGDAPEPSKTKDASSATSLAYGSGLAAILTMLYYIVM